MDLPIAAIHLVHPVPRVLQGEHIRLELPSHVVQQLEGFAEVLAVAVEVEQGFGGEEVLVELVGEEEGGDFLG